MSGVMPASIQLPNANHMCQELQAIILRDLLSPARVPDEIVG